MSVYNKNDRKCPIGKFVKKRTAREPKKCAKGGTPFPRLTTGNPSYRKGDKKMEKEFFKKIARGVLAAVAALSMSACGGGGTAGGGGNNKPVDTSKTQINVKLYDAGFGDGWFNAIAEEFEKKYENVSIEPGKTGIQLLHDGGMDHFSSTAAMTQNDYDIYFLENDSYYALKDGFEDLTSTVTEVNPYDNKKVEDKLTDQQKEFFGITEDGETHYYALPHYYGNIGIVYDKDLFDSENYYFAADKTDSDFITGKTQKKSAGPDGEYNTDDDGLPATYDEFFALLEEIAANGDVPIEWTGTYRTGYFCWLMDALIADCEGAENMMMNYTFSGTEDLVRFDADGSPVFDADGNPVLERVTISKQNGYDVARQPGKYYAFKFLERLLSDNRYYTDKAFLQWSHTQAQQAFLQNGKINNEKDVAMLFDGPWWQRESTVVAEHMAKKDPKWDIKNRNFGWMPLPKATSDKVGSKNVYTDGLNALVCVMKDRGAKKDVCLDFVKYINSDEGLRIFTEKTGAFRGYKYDVPETSLNELTPFSKSLVKYLSNADILYKYTGDAFYNGNLNIFKYDVAYAVRGYTNPLSAFEDNKHDAKSYFKAYYDNLKNGHGDLWKNAK